jgi:hypothetical protein
MSLYKKAIQIYSEKLNDLCDKAIEYLENNIHKKSAFVNLKLFHDIVVNDHKKYKIHKIHYGPINRNTTINTNETYQQFFWRKFITRDRTVFTDNENKYTPFQKKQIQLSMKNYFLNDIYDISTKNQKTFYNTKIMIFRTKPYRPIKRWHSYGYIPTLGTNKVSGKYIHSPYYPDMYECIIYKNLNTCLPIISSSDDVNNPIIQKQFELFMLACKNNEQKKYDFIDYELINKENNISSETKPIINKKKNKRENNDEYYKQYQMSIPKLMKLQDFIDEPDKIKIYKRK